MKNGLNPMRSFLWMPFVCNYGASSVFAAVGASNGTTERSSNFLLGRRMQNENHRRRGRRPVSPNAEAPPDLEERCNPGVDSMCENWKGCDEEFHELDTGGGDVYFLACGALCDGGPYVTKECQCVCVGSAAKGDEEERAPSTDSGQEEPMTEAAWIIIFHTGLATVLLCCISCGACYYFYDPNWEDPSLSGDSSMNKNKNKTLSREVSGKLQRANSRLGMTLKWKRAKIAVIAPAEESQAEVNGSAEDGSTSLRAKAEVLEAAKLPTQSPRQSPHQSPRQSTQQSPRQSSHRSSRQSQRPSPHQSPRPSQSKSPHQSPRPSQTNQSPRPSQTKSPHQSPRPSQQLNKQQLQAMRDELELHRVNRPSRNSLNLPGVPGTS